MCIAPDLGQINRLNQILEIISVSTGVQYFKTNNWTYSVLSSFGLHNFIIS